MGDSYCPENYTAINGLHFQSNCSYNFYCNQNCQWETIHNVLNMTYCMEQCATYNPPCYGITYAWNSQECYIKNKTALTTLVHDNSGDLNSATVNPTTQLTPPSDLSCPVTNNSTLNGYDILCNKDLNAVGLITQWQGPVVPHANSLQECLQFCDNAHPLCSSVAYNVDMIDGYANCYLKPPALSSQGNVPDHNAVFHSGVRNSVAVDASVPANFSYTAANGVQYSILPGQLRTGSTNYSSSHATNISSCLDNCSKNSTCKGVLLDIPMADGYNNCYLLNDTGSPNVGANYTFAMQSTQSSSTSGQGGGSKAWIAGVVVGVLVVIALVLAFLYYRRKSRYRRVEGQEHSGVYSDNRPQPTSYYRTQQKAHIHEMPQTDSMELPVRTVNHVPVELDNGMSNVPIRQNFGLRETYVDNAGLSVQSPKLNDHSFRSSR